MKGENILKNGKIIPKVNQWEAFIESLEMFDQSFMVERNQPEQQKRHKTEERPKKTP